MTIYTKILLQPNMVNTKPEAETPNWDRYDWPHEATRNKMISLIERGEMERYRTDSNHKVEITSEALIVTLPWASRAGAQEWLDFCAASDPFISGEIIETV
jgi:hypothetical protein